MDWGRKWLVDFNSGKTQLVLFDRSDNTGAIGVKMDVFVLEEKLFFISIATIAAKKIGALIRSMKFLFPEVALYLYKSTMWPCM